MEHARTPEQALDLLLALRDEDLEPNPLVDALDPAVRAATEAEDAAFAALLDEWGAADLSEPTFTAADIFAADQRGGWASDSSPVPSSTPAEVERPNSEASTGRATGDTRPPWFVPVALAASLVFAAIGLWALQPPAGEESRPKSLVNETATSRVGLQVTVEQTVDGRAVLTPGRQGAAYGPDDALAFQFELAGEAGWVALLEITPDGDWSVIYPAAGPTFTEPGAHAVADEGRPLVYRPDDPAAGTLTYVAMVTSEDVEPALVVPGLLSAGFERADLWPRPVVAVDAFTVTWE